MKTYLAVDWSNVSTDVYTECCRYAGIDKNSLPIQFHGLHLYLPPKGYTLRWIDSNIARMATFGVKSKRIKY